MSKARWWVALGVVLVGCARTVGDSAQPPVALAQCSCEPATAAQPGAHRSPPGPPARAVIAVCDARGELPLVAARSYLDAGDAAKGLACATQASALTPNDVLAHAERGNALVMLERFDEAKQAFARALAIDPDSLDALLGAAHLYVVALPSSREVDELGSLYAERGLALAHQARDDELVLSFGRLAAMALNDLGASADALERAALVLEQSPGDREATFERAVALFELCRFGDAKRAFTALARDDADGAAAHHYLGLLAERAGHQAEAERHFAAAVRLKPDDFRPPAPMSREAFAAALKAAVAALPADVRADLAGVPVEPAELPDEADLTAEQPPLSPTILGLFRGPPLGTPCEPDAGGPCRSVTLYRRNLARISADDRELLEQLAVTLQHEVGHLRGEDDGELAARGLE